MDFLFPSITIPHSIFILSGFFAFLGVSSSRVLWRLYCEWKLGKEINGSEKKRAALIVGAGDAGVIVAKELTRSPSALHPIGFIDDDPEKWNKTIQGLPVLGKTSDIASIAQKKQIKVIVIAMPSVSGATVRRIMDECKKTSAKVQIMPSLYELISGKVTPNKLRDVDVEDLLRREPVKIELGEVTPYLYNKIVMVTGAGGSIGSELCRQIARVGPKALILIGQGENSIYCIEQELKADYGHLNFSTTIIDIKNRYVMEEIFRTYQPQVLFHTAAHKHVPLMECQPEEAVKNNAWGTKILAEQAGLWGVEKFVLISTDKAVNPTSVMGASKRFAELIVQHYAKHYKKTSFATVRFGNVLGSRGSVIPIFKKQIAQGGPVTVTHPDMVRFFMTIPEAVTLVLNAGALSRGGEIFVLDMGTPVKILDLATELIQLSGLEPGKDIEIQFSGIRPGEKLYEELNHSGETMEPTSHERIMKIAKEIEVHSTSVLPIQQMLRMTDEDLFRLNREDAVRWLEQVNPGYHWEGKESSKIRKAISQK
ncbi:polysaccharide biosynthesis protein [Heliobacterium chlorum]|uniref:Polysaccharide biosynthesis protein n=1 Tax=Heliobacterium chlorum TaxID=2698 RepID=A0ABR7T7M1_HELCL|nr:nucleoside-diphosphate sugar epimerase/dehydratase [Heliobacterium chlorum]MBC9785844.1 polysaccharide biosynthesis protein [Heliobacterium chlorum]